MINSLIKSVCNPQSTLRTFGSSQGIEARRERERENERKTERQKEKQKLFWDLTASPVGNYIHETSVGN